MMNVIVSNKIVLQEVPPHFARMIRKRLTIPNPKYLEAVKHRRWTGNLEKELTYYDVTTDGLILPRGFALQLVHLATQCEASWQLDDRRRVLPEVEFSIMGKLRAYQQQAVKDVLGHDFGVLNAATGSGKTCMAMAIIAARKQPALVIVHTKELLQQWMDRACQFLNMVPGEIGIIGGGEKILGERLTIGIVNSIYPIAEEIKDHFGFLIVDEAHHIPSRTFTEAVSAFDCRFMLGLSATPYRRDGLSRLIYWAMGDQVHTVDKGRLIREGSIMKPEIVTRPTGFVSSFNLTVEYSAGISELTRNTSRNSLIVSDVMDYLKDNGWPVLVLSDRKPHCQVLAEMLTVQGIKTEILTGDLSAGKRKEVVESIRTGEVQTVCATVQLAGEGLDLPELRAVFLGTPIKFDGRLLQSVGRILRPTKGKDRAMVFDYQDINEPVLMAAARSRMKVYNKAA